MALQYDLYKTEDRALHQEYKSRIIDRRWCLFGVVSPSSLDGQYESLKQRTTPVGMPISQLRMQ